MLVLTRKFQEKIRIGNGITITVLRAKGKSVRLGIEAPADVPVIRGELAFKHSPVPSNSAHENASGNSGQIVPPARRHAGHAASAPETKAPFTEVRSRMADPNRDAQARCEVTIERVPRERVGERLPQLLGVGGPLREMLNQRSAAT